MRYLTPEIVRFFSEEAKMAFVAGPRQVGKTTLAKHLPAQVVPESGKFKSLFTSRGVMFTPATHFLSLI